MQRRTFLKAAGATLFLSGLLPRRSARADGDTYSGPVLLTVQAAGGWDPTMLSDGKTPNANLQLNYTAPQQVGAFTVAPISLAVGSTVLEQVPQFFTDFGSRLLVINGVDTQTNSHSIGQKHVWSGKATEQNPTLAAQFAAAKIAQLKLSAPYISLGGGGYDANGSVVQVARLNSTGQLAAIARPNKTGGSTYHDPATYDAIQAAISARLQRYGAQASLASEQESLSALNFARSGLDGLGSFSDSISAGAVSIASVFPNLKAFNDGGLTSDLQSAFTALTAFASGVAISANISSGGFDTHSMHDTNHPAAMGRLMATLRYVFQLADQLGLSSRLYVVVGSDFGRTPTYNAGQGKDHWNVTSMLLAGPGIRGGRVIGGTDDSLRARPLTASDPTKLLAYGDASGVVITPEHIHRAFRKTSGIDTSSVASTFPLAVTTPLDDLLS